MTRNYAAAPGAPPRIALILPTLMGGGAERVALTLADGFACRGIDVRFALGKAKGDLLDEAQTRFSVTDLALGRMRTSVPRIAKFLSSFQPAATLSFMWPLNGYCILAHRLAGSPGRMAVSEHCVLSREYAGFGAVHRALLRGSIAALYRFADARIVVSHGVAMDMAALGSIPASRFSVIHNPIPRARPVADTTHAEAVWGARNGPRFLTVGTLKEVKNHALLIDAFARLHSTTGGRLVILGEGQLRGELEAQVSRLGLIGRVILPGFELNPTPFYQTADLFALSSNYEGFGNVLVEAIQHGLNVVSTDCPSGPREILREGSFGRLVPVNDAAALADGLQQALAAPIPGAALRARARNFDADVIVDHYLDLLLPLRGCDRTMPDGGAG